MAQQDYDVIINDKEYKQLKESKTHLENIQKQLKESISQGQSQNVKIISLEKDNHIKQAEIYFLVSLIDNLANHDKQTVLDLESIKNSTKSGTFEVLGESVMFPNTAESKKIDINQGELMKKYAGSLASALKLEKKLESQQQLISKLNKINTEQSELLLNKNEEQLLALVSETSIKINSFSDLKKIVTSQHILTEEKARLEKQAADRSMENGKLKDQIKKLAQILGQYTDKIRKAELQCAQLKKIAKRHEEEHASLPIGDRPYRIKLLIDQHIKQMESSLIGVGGLTNAEIKSMLDSELKSLLEYIPKSLKK